MHLIIHMHAEAPFAYTRALQDLLHAPSKVASPCSGSKRVLCSHHMR